MNVCITSVCVFLLTAPLSQAVWANEPTRETLKEASQVLQVILTDIAQIETKIVEKSENLDALKGEHVKNLTQLKQLNAEIGNTLSTVTEINNLIGEKSNLVGTFAREMYTTPQLPTVLPSGLGVPILLGSNSSTTSNVNMLPEATLNQFFERLSSETLHLHERKNNTLAVQEGLREEKREVVAELEKVETTMSVERQQLDELYQTLATKSNELEKNKVQYVTDEQRVTQKEYENLVQQAIVEYLTAIAANNTAISEREKVTQEGLMEKLANRPTLLGGESVAVTSAAQGWVWPLTDHLSPNSDPGDRDHPATGAPGCHEGSDIAAPIGTPIVSPSDGTVVKVVKSDYGYGNHVVIQHNSLISTWHAHMSTINVRLGQKVKTGETIGNVGSTGDSTGPHLHYEVRAQNTPLHPELWHKGIIQKVSCTKR